MIGLLTELMRHIMMCHGAFQLSPCQCTAVGPFTSVQQDITHSSALLNVTLENMDLPHIAALSVFGGYFVAILGLFSLIISSLYFSKRCARVRGSTLAVFCGLTLASFVHTWLCEYRSPMASDILSNPRPFPSRYVQVYGGQYNLFIQWAQCNMCFIVEFCRLWTCPSCQFLPSDFAHCGLGS